MTSTRETERITQRTANRHMAAVFLHKKRKARLEQGHPWVYKSEIERVDGEVVPGQLVPVQTHLGQYLATGYYNEASQITVRIVSYKPLEAMTTDFSLSGSHAACSIAAAL